MIWATLARVKESATIARESSPRRSPWEAPPSASQPRSNSYNFVPVRDVPRAAGAPCPLREHRIPREGARTLLVRLRDRMRLVRTTTSDFSDQELTATRDTLGQVYADVSTKLAPDDFARDLRKLEPSAECASCPVHSECPGAWEAVPGDVFGRDDARVLALLAGLSGRILDVGGGDATYLAPLLARAARERVEYVCVDPDEARLALLASRHPGHPSARFLAGRAESLPEGLGLFDHVLFLRSYNHLVDPARALSRALAVLRPGGSLLLVDNVAFGLVRSAPHAARAEAAPENQLEHYRNDGAAEAHGVVLAAALASGRALHLGERRDVAPHTSNQWLLHYR
jgi:SAM-dependent methyltransferase